MEDKNRNNLIESADEYLRRHRVQELFEDISASACFKQPSNLKEFIVDELKTRQRQGFKLEVWSQIEVRNTFELFDLKKQGYISKESCRNALLAMASSEYQEQVIKETETIDDKVDLNRFARLCEIFLGIKQT